MGDQVGDDLFVRRAQGHLDLAVLAANGELDQHVAERGHAARLFPKRDGRQRRHQQFDRAGLVHGLADDRFGLAKGSQSQRQIGVGACHDLIDQACAQHQDVAGDFRPFGRFLHGRDQGLGPKHGIAIVIVREGGFPANSQSKHAGENAHFRRPDP